MKRQSSQTPQHDLQGLISELVQALPTKSHAENFFRDTSLSYYYCAII